MRTITGKTLEDVVTTYGNKSKNYGVYALIHCPCHNDRNPSLEVSINEKSEFSVHCHAGCDFREILRDFELKGLQEPFKPKKNGSAPDPTWRAKQDFAEAKKTDQQPLTDQRKTPKKCGTPQHIYRSEDGTPLYGVHRWKNKDGTKGMMQSHYRESSNEWFTGRVNIPRILYNLDKLQVTGKGPLLFVEGEKCVDALTAAGFFATTSGNAKSWQPHFTKELKKQNVVIIADNDAPGEALAQQVFNDCSKAGIKASILPLPGLPEKGDVVDFLEQEGGADRLRGLIEAQQPESWLGMSKDVFEYAFVEPEPPDAVVTGIFDIGDKVAVIGQSKRKKSFFTTQLGLCIAKGIPFLGFDVPKKRRVLLVQFEIKEAQFHFRLHRMQNCAETDFGFHQPNEYFYRVIHGRGRGLNVKHLLSIAEEIRPEVLIIDPIYKLLLEENSAEAIKPLLATFDLICEKVGSTLIYVHHDAKGIAGQRDSVDRGAGSGVLGRDYDSALILSSHADAEKKELAVVETVLRNYPEVEPFCAEFQVEDLMFEQSKEVAEKQIAPNTSKASSKVPNEDYFDCAIDYINKEQAFGEVVIGSGRFDKGTLMWFLHKKRGLAANKTKSIKDELTERAMEFGLEVYNINDRKKGIRSVA